MDWFSTGKSLTSLWCKRKKGRQTHPSKTKGKTAFFSNCIIRRRRLHTWRSHHKYGRYGPYQSSTQDALHCILIAISMVFSSPFTPAGVHQLVDHRMSTSSKPSCLLLCPPQQSLCHFCDFFRELQAHIVCARLALALLASIHSCKHPFHLKAPNQEVLFASRLIYSK